MSVQIAQRVCAVTSFSFRFSATPPTTKTSPTAKPIATRTSGGMRLCSKEYFTKNATPRKSASPPSHANNLAPMNCSQLIAGSEDSGTCGLAEDGGGGIGEGADAAAAITSSGKGGGTETGRASRDSAIGSETKGSRSAVSVSFFA